MLKEKNVADNADKVKCKGTMTKWSVLTNTINTTSNMQNKTLQTFNMNYAIILFILHHYFFIK